MKVSTVAAEAYAAAQLVKRGLMGSTDRLALELAAESEPAKIKQRLDEHFSKLLEDLSNAQQLIS